MINVNNFSFSYPEGEPVVKNVSFSLSAGEIMLITGNNGCGKTTLLRALKKEIAPKGEKSGEIALNCSAAFLFQECDKNIIFKNAYEDLVFPACNAGIESEEILRRADEITALFGIERLLEQNTDSLSGGEKQILALASLLLPYPELIVLDEPLSQLDSEAKATFCQKLFLVNKTYGTAIIIAEHNTDDLFEKSDKIMLMEDGKGILYDKGHIPSNLFHINLPEYIKLQQKLNVKQLSFTKSDAAKKIEEIKSEIKINKKSASVFSDEVVLKCENLHFSYDYEVLKGLNLDIKKGEIAFLTGKNGAGKSTLFRIICGFLKPKVGSVKIGDVKLGYLSQNPVYSFLQDTVEDDFSYALQKNSLPKTAFEDCLKKFPEYEDIKKLFSSNPLDLSGGERAKAAMLKQLLLQRGLILLDEPEKHLDKKSAAELSSAIRSLAESGISFLIISHTPDFVYDTADTVKLLEDGVINSFSVEEYFETKEFTNLRRALAGTQLHINSVKEASLWV